MPTDGVHILGASGSGTTTLGAALAQHLGWAHLDTDGFYWEPTDPPFQIARPPPERLERIEAEMARHPAWVLSGSLIGWGDALIPRFRLVVFLQVPPEVRLPRLKQREIRRYGDRIAPQGDLATHHAEFMAYATSYDDPAFKGRSLVRHKAWLASLRCPVLCIEGAPTPDESLAQVLTALWA